MSSIQRRMRYGLLCLLLLGNTFSAHADDPFASAVRPTEALSPEDEQKALRVPPGFRVQLFASEPEILKPVNMAFDERGRLWVSCTQDYPFVNLQHPGDSIRILEDTDGDGAADKVTIFVEGITHPMGLLPCQEGVIAFSIPNIKFFRDTDGDGKCDTRQILYGPFDYSKDTHGLNNGFRRGHDGWIYACHGFNNHSVVQGKDGNVLDVSSGSTYRFRPDGSRIERYTFGQINPFGMSFDANGDLFSSDCHSKPLMLMIRDGQYRGFGRQHDGLGFAPEVMTHSHGSTAIAGVTQAGDERFPREFRDNYFVGNVMTSRVNRDSLTITGSSMKAVEEPDFVISDDPWFRPVDLQQGPDGALYIADFYNKIIGHYEVPLNHPGRDRTRGRIWRVVPIDSGDTLTAVKDLSSATVPELLKAADTTNLPRQIQALDELTDRWGREAVTELKRQLESDLSDSSRITALWALHRLGGLSFVELEAGLSASSGRVRVHAQRILADRSNWSPEESQTAVAGLSDSHPFVQRAAGDALARHPELSHVRPLLAAWQRVPPHDPALEYQLKLALRNQFRLPGSLPTVLRWELSSRDRQSLATVALGNAHAEAAVALLEWTLASQTDHIPPVDLVTHISHHGSSGEINSLIGWIRSRWRDDVEMQIRLLGAVRSGMRKQGIEQTDVLAQWGTELAKAIFHEKRDASAWVVLAPADGGTDVNWRYEWRTADADGSRQSMLSSLPGGERSVSTLRSPAFTLPSEFSFLICGHLGFPAQPPRPDNYVRLCLVEGNREIARQLPPRHDNARRIQWDLSEYQGQQGYLEVVDGLDLNGYAWLAIGGIDPAVLPLPSEGIQSERQRLQLAIQLVREFGLRQYRDELVSLSDDRTRSLDLRAAALETVAAWDDSPLAAGLAALWRSGSLNSDQREQLFPLVVQGEASFRFQQLRDLARTLPTREQVGIAQALLSQNGGDSVLLDLCESNGLSPQVLASSAIRPRLEQSVHPAIRDRAQQLLKQLPATSADLDRQMASLRKKAGERTADLMQGRKIFEARCAVCHQLQGIGKIIGPQLDGIGHRGLERLLEDVLDPNRNVDEAFRSRTFALDDGRVLSGMFRRQEGALLVIADNKGDELSFPAADVEQQAVSQVSIMPDNWSEILPESELLDLLAYLGEQKK